MDGARAIDRFRCCEFIGAVLRTGTKAAATSQSADEAADRRTGG